MKFDLRFPISILFSFYGALLTVHGLVGDQEQYARSLDININLWWGLVLLVFGAAMLFLVLRGARRDAGDKK